MAANRGLVSEHVAIADVDSAGAGVDDSVVEDRFGSSRKLGNVDLFSFKNASIVASNRRSIIFACRNTSLFW
jgi:hypothetical protein